MTEPEIDALMAGQEDENGSVHYEGELTFSPSAPLLLLFLKILNTFSVPPAFVKHIMSV